MFEANLRKKVFADLLHYLHFHSNALEKVGDIIEKIRERRANAILNFEQFSFIFEYLNIYAQKFYREKIEEIF